MKEVDLQREFSIMPISTGMERLVILCVENILTEIQFFDEIDRVPSMIDFDEALACDMTAISNEITNFFHVSCVFKQKEIIKP